MPAPPECCLPVSWWVAGGRALPLPRWFQGSPKIMEGEVFLQLPCRRWFWFMILPGVCVSWQEAGRREGDQRESWESQARPGHFLRKGLSLAPGFPAPSTHQAACLVSCLFDKYLLSPPQPPHSPGPSAALDSMLRTGLGTKPSSIPALKRHSLGGGAGTHENRSTNRV